MIHQWFTHFGLYALLLAIAGYALTRFVVNRRSAKNSDDKQGVAWVSILFAVLTVIAGLVAVILLFSGTPAAIP